MLMKRKRYYCLNYVIIDPFTNLWKSFDSINWKLLIMLQNFEIEWKTQNIIIKALPISICIYNINMMKLM